jgi:predicted acetyltransferase
LWCSNAELAGFPVVDLKPRLIDPDELPRVMDLSSIGFGIAPTASDEYRRELDPLLEADRTFVVDDRDILAGTAGAFSLQVALPGGAVPMCGVTEVAVRPTHRRRGILRTLMDAVLDQAIERGEPLAGLTASEAGIYRRFGFGVASRVRGIKIDRARSAELVDVRAPGEVRLLSEAEAKSFLPAVWDKVWPTRVGEVTRSAGWWASGAVDPADDRDGASPRFLAGHEDLDGFAVYRFKEAETTGGGFYELQIVDLAAADDPVEAALVRYLLDVDLVGHVRWGSGPVGLPLRWRLVDSRAVQVTRERDWLWLRPLDVAACLSRRGYAAEGGAVLEVVDEARPAVGGRFQLDGGSDGAECARTTAEPDVVMRTPELGVLMLGDASWTTLRRAGLIDERSPGAVDRLDALFRTSRPPYCATGF